MVPEAQRQLDPEGTRAAIMQAATELFVAGGFAATSMTTIAREAKVTKSLIHHHFGSKRELWDAVKSAATASYGQRQATMLEEQEPNLDLVEQSMRTYFRFLQENPRVVRLVSWMAVEQDEACAEVLGGLNQQGIAVLRMGQEAGHIRRDVEAEIILAQFHTLIRGWFTEKQLLQNCVVDLGETVDTEELYLEGMLKVFLQGLRPAS